MQATTRTSPVSRSDAIVHRILTAVATHEQCDVLDLPPLSEIIDPDALGRITQESNAEITFSYHGYRVSIDGDGHVDVAPEQE